MAALRFKLLPAVWLWTADVLGHQIGIPSKLDDSQDNWGRTGPRSPPYDSPLRPQVITWCRGFAETGRQGPERPADLSLEAPLPLAAPGEPGGKLRQSGSPAQPAHCKLQLSRKEHTSVRDCQKPTSKQDVGICEESAFRISFHPALPATGDYNHRHLGV